LPHPPAPAGYCDTLSPNSLKCCRLVDSLTLHSRADYSTRIGDKIGNAEHSFFVKVFFRTISDGDVGTLDHQLGFQAVYVFHTNNIGLRRWNPDVALDTLEFLAMSLPGPESVSPSLLWASLDRHRSPTCHRREADRQRRSSIKQKRTILSVFNEGRQNNFWVYLMDSNRSDYQSNILDSVYPCLEIYVSRSTLTLTFAALSTRRRTPSSRRYSVETPLPCISNSIRSSTSSISTPIKKES